MTGLAWFSYAASGKKGYYSSVDTLEVINVPVRKERRWVVRYKGIRISSQEHAQVLTAMVEADDFRLEKHL